MNNTLFPRGTVNQTKRVQFIINDDEFANRILNAKEGTVKQNLLHAQDPNKCLA